MFHEVSDSIKCLLGVGAMSKILKLAYAFKCMKMTESKMGIGTDWIVKKQP
jgi:hypothetical protein